MILRFFISFLVLCLLFANTSCAMTNDIQADPVFAQWSAVLKANKKITISAVAIPTITSIKVDSCMLQERNGSVWQDYISLPPPSYISNTNVYSVTVDYSSTISSGTFRIVVTLNANGYTKDIYSNAKTF